MKQCNLDCDFQQEGYCVSEVYSVDGAICKAKTNNDLITEDEYKKRGEAKFLTLSVSFGTNYEI